MTGHPLEGAIKLANSREVKRNKIIEVAAREFAEKGYDNSNINEIATMSGIGKGSIYLYFKTKKDLYLATIASVVQQFNEASIHILNMDCSPMEKLRICIESLFKFEEDNLHFLILWARYQIQNAPDFQEEVNDIFKDIEQPFCDIVKEGVRKEEFHTPYPEATGYLILSMVTMLIPSLQAKPILFDISVDSKIEYLVDLIRNGLECTK